MAQPHYPTIKEVKALLDSHELREYEQAVAVALRLPLLPSGAMDVARIQRELYLANLTAEAATEVIARNAEKLVRFAVAIYLREAEQPQDGEFPEGETQDPSETEQILGLGSGFGATHVCYYHLAGLDKSEPLLLFLERTRIAFRKKFCAFLVRCRNSLHDSND